MEPRIVVKENWLTRKPLPSAEVLTWLLGILLAVAGYAYLNSAGGADEWMPATRQSVFTGHEYWRLWTSLFAHGDFGHLLSNALLFFPFAYFLSAYFGPYFFPFFGLLVGGLINAIVLVTMPAQTGLIGISGVVSWMGAAWLTLFLLVETRSSFRRRLAVALLLSFVLFGPETYKQNVSYLSHFVGFVLGVMSATGYYALNRRKFLAAEITEKVFDHHEELWTGDPQDSSEALRASSSR
jgi:rhomboid protease GluP